MNLTHLLHLKLTELPRSPDLAIFVFTTTTAQLIALPIVHVHWVNIRAISGNHIWEAGTIIGVVTEVGGGG